MCVCACVSLSLSLAIFLFLFVFVLVCVCVFFFSLHISVFLFYSVWSVLVYVLINITFHKSPHTSLSSTTPYHTFLSIYHTYHILTIPIHQINPYILSILLGTPRHPSTASTSSTGAHNPSLACTLAATPTREALLKNYYEETSVTASPDHHRPMLKNVFTIQP